jgi:GDP-4-dehydro-6-deoxy-D-mannose reductase
MRKYLITGANGFVASHFLDLLESLSIEVEIVVLDLSDQFSLAGKTFKYLHLSYYQMNLLDSEKIKRLLIDFQPDYILHLASYSSVAYSWEKPVESFVNNTNIFLNLVDAIQKHDLHARLLSVGSSEEYGNVRPEDIPLRENTPLNPLSPYAVARVSQEMLSKVYADSLNLDAVMTRSFNHIGPGQRSTFVVSSFIKQAVDAKLSGKSEMVLTTGDVTIIRDFLDVRDVVSAYNLLFEQGKCGEIYNICSGISHALSDIIAIIADQLQMQITINVNPHLIRPNDNKIIVGDNSKLVKTTGWNQRYSLEQSIEDIISYFTHDEK